MSARLKKLKNLNLQPLNLQPLTFSKQYAEDLIHKDKIINKLKHMDRDDVLRLFEEFDVMLNKDDIHFEVEELGEYDGRKLVKVDDQKFYKSTGTSRGTHLKGIFLPYDKINRDAMKETKTKKAIFTS